MTGRMPNADNKLIIKSTVTNADRIRAMTDEELAGWISKLECEITEDCAFKNCKDCILNWLKQEADDV